VGDGGTNGLGEGVGEGVGERRAVGSGFDALDGGLLPIPATSPEPVGGVPFEPTGLLPRPASIPIPSPATIAKAPSASTPKRAFIGPMIQSNVSPSE
jgi:hypothetical protein